MSHEPTAETVAETFVTIFLSGMHDALRRAPRGQTGAGQTGASEPSAAGEGATDG